MDVTRKASMMCSVLLTTLLLAACSGNSDAQDCSADLDVDSISIEATLTHAGATDVTLCITNNGPETVCVWSWNILAEGTMHGPSIVMTIDGAEIDYTGPLVRREGPDENEWIAIAPGSSIESTIDLAPNFPLAPGDVSATFREYVLLRHVTQLQITSQSCFFEIE